MVYPKSWRTHVRVGCKLGLRQGSFRMRTATFSKVGVDGWHTEESILVFGRSRPPSSMGHLMEFDSEVSQPVYEIKTLWDSIREHVQARSPTFRPDLLA